MAVYVPCADVIQEIISRQGTDIAPLPQRVQDLVIEGNDLGITYPQETAINYNDNEIDWLELHNKRPQWSAATQAFVLNFNGRVAAASVKNFQIVHDHNLEHVCLQFGRVDKDEFSMDVQYPFSLLQAFAVALTRYGYFI